MDVLQSAASSSDFFKRAATGIIELVGLDVGHVLLRDGEDWRVVASGAAPRRPTGGPADAFSPGCKRNGGRSGRNRTTESMIFAASSACERLWLRRF